MACWQAGVSLASLRTWKIKKTKGNSSPVSLLFFRAHQIFLLAKTESIPYLQGK
jgi:hypothetical protein